jgi:hypothetical protein
MKGILHKAKQGWIVVYDEIIGENIVKKNQNSLPLHPDSESLYMFAELKEGWENNLEGKEVEFEVRVYPSNTSYAKIIYKEDVGHCAELDESGCGLDCSYPDCICQGNEITDCKNRTPEQVVLGYKTALVEDVFHQGMKKTAMQQLIDEIVEHLTYDDDLTDDNRTTLETIRLRCLGKLSMEKDQIINTFKDAQVFKVMNDETRAEQYYYKIYGK